LSIEPEVDAEELNTSGDTMKPVPDALRGQSLLIADLGWTTEEAADTRTRLRPLAEEWDDAEMSLYDELLGGAMSFSSAILIPT
jgi:hypothetical protein